MTIGEKIKQTRKKSGLSQEQFADALNISRSAVAKWENDLGLPDISNLKSISKLLNVSIDYLLDEEQEVEIKDMKLDLTTNDNQPQKDEISLCPEYEGYYCQIKLNGWNDGVSDAMIIGHDSNFLYYQREEKKKPVYGMIGKKYIVSVERAKKMKKISETENISRLYFIDKNVTLEVACKEGVLKGLFDFTNDKYLDAVIKRFGDLELELQFGETIDIDKVTKIEELQD